MTGNNWNARMTALAEQAAEELIGTCKSKSELGAEIEEAFDDVVFCARVDDLCFECVQCNWWCEINEMAETSDGEFICKECNE